MGRFSNHQWFYKLYCQNIVVFYQICEYFIKYLKEFRVEKGSEIVVLTQWWRKSTWIFKYGVVSSTKTNDIALYHKYMWWNKDYDHS